jgi:hypothetical protein
MSEIDGQGAPQALGQRTARGCTIEAAAIFENGAR